MVINLTQALLIILPILWMILIPLSIHSSWNQASTIEKLKLTELAIAKFEKSHGRLPASISEIRHFLYSLEIPYTPYDSYGQRIQYIKLSPEEYFLKSFGSDSQSHGGSSNLTHLKIKSNHERTIDPVPSSTGPLSLYPAPLLLGTSSPRNNFVAKLITEHASNTRRLVVLKKNDPNFVLVSFHDGIEEFFWLHNGTSIVFTAGGSERYRDGVYVWDLSTDEAVNILDQIAQKHFPSKPEKFYLSLSSVDYSSLGFYVIVYPALEPKLDPKAFYQFRNLFKVTLNKDKFEVNNFVEGANLFEFKISPSNQIATKNSGQPAQEQWARLPTTGNINFVIDTWQKFCTRNYETPLFPYCLWWLSSLYNDGYETSLSKDKSIAITVRSFGVEVSQLLDEQVNAPEYLRAMGYFIKNTLQQGSLTGYNVSQMNLNSSN